MLAFPLSFTNYYNKGIINIQEYNSATWTLSIMKKLQKVTIKDIARICNVSTQTVSRVMNKRPDVAPDTREAVEKARAQAKGDEKIGVDIILHALEAPIRQIAENGGIDGAVVADEVAQKDVNIGYDANKGEYVDMLKAGIIDPVKVVRVALTNAASISGLLLTTEALVTNLDKDDAKKRKIEGSVR